MKRSFILLLCLMGIVPSKAQSPFSLSAVPDSIRKKASVITHSEEQFLEVENPEKVYYKVKKVFTILNEEGKQALVFSQHINKAIVLEDAEIRVFDQAGKQISRVKKKEMLTEAYGEGLVDDSYITWYRVSPTAYPITIEHNYTVLYKTTLWLPHYRFIHPEEAVLKSTYTAKLPLDMKLRYKPVHTSIRPVVTEDSRYRTYTWSVNNIPAVEYESGSVAYLSSFPHVKLAAERFSLFGYDGNLGSWKEFGNWVGELNKGMDELSAERQQFFRELVQDIPDEKEKVRRIYRFLQENFRYVSIQLGIGGYRSFPAKFTDEKKYGDCKALSVYMKAALNAVGIKSNVALINASYNDEPVDPSFPINSFNHMILCVPGRQDSIWLECTSNTNEFGILGNFTENRNALLITDQGGVLVPTPKSEAGNNYFITKTVVTIDRDLSALTDTRIRTRGEYSEMMSSVSKEKRDDQKTILVRYMGYKQPDDFILTKEGTGEFILKLALRKIHEFNAGTKFFLNPRVSRIWTSKLPVYENRKLDYYFHHPFQIMDTTVMILPEGFVVDALPKEKSIQNSYASYHTKTWHNAGENAVYTTTSLVLERYKILAADYKAIRQFFEEVIQDDSQRLVVKGTPGEPAKKAF